MRILVDINVRLFGVVLWVLFGFVPVSAAQQDDSMLRDPTGLIDEIQRAIQAGNAEAVARHAGAYVEVTMEGATTLHSQAQTAYILKAFFREHPPDAFVFQRRMRLGRDWFMYGRYWYRGDNRPYRIEVLIRWNGRRHEIKSLRIEPMTR